MIKLRSKEKWNSQCLPYFFLKHNLLTPHHKKCELLIPTQMFHLGQRLYHVLLLDLDMIFLQENFQICFFISISKHLNQDKNSTLLFCIDEILFSLFNYYKGKLEIHIYRGINPQERFPGDFSKPEKMDCYLQLSFLWENHYYCSGKLTLKMCKNL